MPLGNLKKSQISAGFAVLTSIQQILDADNLSTVARRQKLSDLSNQFFTLIPHDFGVGQEMKAIESTEALRDKIKMIETLLDIEATVSILSDKSSTPSADAPKTKRRKKTAKGAVKKEATQPAQSSCEVDEHYAKLRCELTPLEPDTPAYKQLAQFVENTKASVGSYKFEKWPQLQIKSIFSVERQGEAERYAPQRKKLGHNRKLLWHGSGTSNYGGILSQGMRIAPPEAPKTGCKWRWNFARLLIISKASTLFPVPEF
jgi:hypothetical protein